MNGFKNMIGGSFALVATFVTVATATPLRAETVAQPVRVSVPYGDLDVRSDAGASTLQARIRTAAFKVCEQDDAGCRLSAIRSAKTQIASKGLNAQVQLASR